MIDLTQLTVRPDNCVRLLRQAGYRPDPPENMGPAGFRLLLRDDARHIYGSVIVTQSDLPDDPTEWLHASIARNDRMPDYADLTALKAATFGRHREAYQVFTADTDHISIHDQALHLWGRADGQRVLPEFGAWGTI